MPIDNRCMYMAHVFFYVCCSDCVRNVGMFVVYWLLLKIVCFIALECLSMLYVCVRGVMDVVFSASIVRV